MYTITQKNSYLLITFQEDFNSSVLKAIMRHEPNLKDQIQTDEIWDCSNFQALLGLGDIQPVIDAFKDRLSTTLATKKIAIVSSCTNETALQLLTSGLDSQLPCACKFFPTHEEAAAWITMADLLVAY